MNNLTGTQPARVRLASTSANAIPRLLPAFILMVLATSAQALSPQSEPPADKGKARIAKETRHEIVTLPYFDVFDNIELRLDGYTLIVAGQVTRPSLKAKAESELRGIEGVENVVNNMEVLPLSPNDDRFEDGDLSRDLWLQPAIPLFDASAKTHPDHREEWKSVAGRVVDSEGDKNLVKIRASGVSAVFSVTNNLRVER